MMMGYQIGTINFQLFRVAVRWPQNSYLEIIQTKHNQNNTPFKYNHHEMNSVFSLNLNNARVPFWPNKVFEGVHCHVIDLLL